MLASTPFTIALRDVLGERFRVHPDDCARSAVGGVVPKLVLSPRTLDEAARAVKIIAGEHASVVIRGAGTKSNRPPRRAEIDAVIDTSELRGVLEHKPGDLTATVAAGTPLRPVLPERRALCRKREPRRHAGRQRERRAPAALRRAARQRAGRAARAFGRTRRVQRRESRQERRGL